MIYAPGMHIHRNNEDSWERAERLEEEADLAKQDKARQKQVLDTAFQTRRELLELGVMTKEQKEDYEHLGRVIELYIIA